MSDTLLPLLNKLRLSGLAASLEVRLHEATSSGLTHREFLELVLQDEIMTRDDRRMNRRIVAAAFRDQRRLEDFDFSFNPSIKRTQVFDLATCRFIREAKHVLFIGPPGTGKSFLAQAIGYQAIKQGHIVLYARSSTWCETSCRTRCLKARIACWPSTQAGPADRG